MVSLKRQIYGLQILRPYRMWRARQIAAKPRRVAEGFAIASYDMAFDDDWEREERAAIARLLPSCAAFVDVGANNGFYALLAAHLGTPSLAIEPDAGNLVVLRQNAAGKPIEIVAGAVSESAGTVDLFGDGDMASFDPAWQGVGRHFRQTVATMRLDTLLEDRWPGEQLLIKVDVEGAEALVLRGASATLARTPRPFWLIETLPTLPNGALNTAFAQVERLMADYSATPLSGGNILYQ